MTPERELPEDWEQRIDLHWIEENLDVFQRVASRDMKWVGRGVIAVDIAHPPIDGGHPVVYWPQTLIEEYGDAEMKRLVAAYDLDHELVVMLLKPGKRLSSVSTVAAA